MIYKISLWIHACATRKKGSKNRDMTTCFVVGLKRLFSCFLVQKIFNYIIIFWNGEHLFDWLIITFIISTTFRIYYLFWCTQSFSLVSFPHIHTLSITFIICFLILHTELSIIAAKQIQWVFFWLAFCCEICVNFTIVRF